MQSSNTLLLFSNSLFHILRNNSTFSGATCDPNHPGDGVDDTPQHKVSPIGTCNVGQDSCDGGGVDRKSFEIVKNKLATQIRFISYHSKFAHQYSHIQLYGLLQLSRQGVYDRSDAKDAWFLLRPSLHDQAVRPQRVPN